MSYEYSDPIAWKSWVSFVISAIKIAFLSGIFLETHNSNKRQKKTSWQLKVHDKIAIYSRENRNAVFFKASKCSASYVCIKGNEPNQNN